MNRQSTPATEIVPSKGASAGGEQGDGAHRAPLQRLRKRRRVTGRPPKYSESQWREVAKEIGRGMPVKYACLLQGIPVKTFESRLQTKPSFQGAVELEKAKWLRTALDIIGCDLPGHVGSRWILERRHAADFHKPADVNVSVTSNVQAGLVVTPELQAELAQIARQHFTKAGRA